ncbi:probable protein odr-4 homolog [Coccomyxa sp. Obi]|nr:probable protein odr-4 homolog [Coccomyxa sp. Obi]
MRTCQVDESVLAYINDLSQGRSQAQVGLLIGRLGIGNRDFLLLLIPCPPVEGGTEAVRVQGGQSQTPAKKAGQKAKGSGTAGLHVQINHEWVAEHASQVAPLVPGGLAVVGLYFFGPDAAFAASSTQLCRSLLSLRDACPDAGSLDQKDLLLLNVCSVTQKITLKELPASAANASALKACECKSAPVLANLSVVTTRHPIDASCPVVNADREARQHFEAMIARESQSIAGSVPFYATGSPFKEDTLVADTCSADGSAIAIDLLTAPDCSSHADLQNKAEAHGRACIRGVIEGTAVVHKRDSVKTAVAFLKADLQRSLQARMAVLLMDAEDLAQSQGSKPELLHSGADGYQSAFRLPMPQRAFVLVKAPVQFSDYPLEEDAADSVMTTAQELLALKSAKPGQIAWPEKAASGQEAEILWQPLRPHPRMKATITSSSRGDEQVTAPIECNSFVVGAIVVGVLAVVAGLGYLVL